MGFILRMEFLFLNMTPSTVESTNYSVGRHDSVRVDEGRKRGTLLATKTQGTYRSGERGRRANCCATPDLGYDYEGKQEYVRTSSPGGIPKGQRASAGGRTPPESPPRGPSEASYRPPARHRKSVGGYYCLLSVRGVPDGCV